MKRIRKYTSFLLLLSILFSSVIHAGNHGCQNDPMDNINYHDAFDQASMHKKYEPLIKAWKCDKNVFGLEYAKKDNEVELDKETISKMEKEFRDVCFKKLYGSRRWAIVEPALHSMSYMALMTTATIIVSKMIDKDSLGGSFSVFSSIFNSVFFLQDIIKSGYQLAFPKQSSLGSLELQFALTQCFIPKDLWPAIIEKFMVARQNQYEQAKAMNFLEFSLGLTVYKPTPALDFQEKSIEQIIQTLHEKIDRFFDDYQKEGVEQSVRLIKISVSKFILRLLGQKDVMPRYIYFHGPTGIGKTFFVHELCKWIEQLVPDSVRFDNMVITASDELEGNPQRPGALLRILRNQLIANKRGSVVFMDEATWLNEMKSASKRTFNGDQSTLSTDYFGDGIEGAGISIAIPPMLFFLASNDEIQDPALKSRFDIVQFPNPTPHALAMHAMAKAKESVILSGFSGASLPENSEFEAWVEKEKIVNFRQAAALVEDFVLSHAEQPQDF